MSSPTFGRPTSIRKPPPSRIRSGLLTRINDWRPAVPSPGEILVSATVRDLARTSAGVTFEDRGEQILKGIDDPVRVFAIRAG